jgi:hypothetical protein
MTETFVARETLRDYLRRAGRLAPGEALPLFAQLLRELSAVHAQGVTHRDIKPDNIVLEESGESPVVKITDFGVADVQSAPVTEPPGVIVGTPAYMAPETIKGTLAGPPADMFAAGIVLYEMLAGRPPFTGDTVPVVVYLMLNTEPPPIEGLQDPTGSIWRLLTQLLDKDPARRPSADQALNLLEPIQLAGAAERLAALAVSQALSESADLPPDDPRRVTSPIGEGSTRRAPADSLASRFSVLTPRERLTEEEVEHEDGTLHRFDLGSDEFVLVDVMGGKPTMNWTTALSAGEFAELVDQYLEDDTEEARVTIGVDEIIDEMGAEIGVALARLGGDPFNEACNFFRLDTEDLSLAYQVLPSSDGSGKIPVFGVSAARLAYTRVFPLIVRTGTEQVNAHILSVRADALAARLEALLSREVIVVSHVILSGPPPSMPDHSDGPLSSSGEFGSPSPPESPGSGT